jgi:hypothetical protein
MTWPWIVACVALGIVLIAIVIVARAWLASRNRDHAEHD